MRTDYLKLAGFVTLLLFVGSLLCNLLIHSDLQPYGTIMGISILISAVGLCAWMLSPADPGTPRKPH